MGVLDAGLTGALTLYGVSPVHAVVAVLVYHAIALWVPGLGGLYAYLRLRPGRLTSGDRPVARGDNPEPQPRVASGLDGVLDPTGS